MKSVFSFVLFFLFCGHSQAAQGFSNCSLRTQELFFLASAFADEYIEGIVRSNLKVSSRVSSSQLKKLKRSFKKAKYKCKSNSSSLSCMSGALAYVIPFGSTVYLCEQNIERYGYDDTCSAVGITAHEISHVSGLSILDLKHNSLTDQEKLNDLSYMIERSAEKYCRAN